jgi:hypothetical protein
VKQHLAVVVFLFVSVSPLLAQPGPNATPARTAELGLSFGFTAVHRPEMWSAVTSHAFGGSATLLRPAAGAWTTAGRRGLRPPPLEGLELAFSSAGGPGVGPQAHAVWIVRHPLSQRSAFEAGTGIGWAFAPYDPDLRPGNFILGSHLNAALRLGLLTTPFPHLRLGLAFTHLSNGSFAQPNLGTNLLTARAALVLPSPPPQTQTQPPSPTQTPTQPQSQLSLFTGAREAGLPDSKRHIVGGLQATYTHPVRGSAVCLRATGGLTVNSSLRATHVDGPTESLRDWVQPHLAAGLEWPYGRARFVLAYGTVFLNTDRILGKRLLLAELGWRLSPHIEAVAGLRAFGFRADFPYVGVAMMLPRHSGQVSPKAARNTSRSDVPTTPLPSKSSGHTGATGT